MVKVRVEVPTVEESVQVNSPSRVQFVKTLIVVRLVGSLFVTVKLPTLTVPSTMLPVPISARPLNTMLWPVFVRTDPLFIVRVAVAVIVEDRETVPPIVTA